LKKASLILLLLALGRPAFGGETPEDAYRDAVQAFESGKMEEAGGKLEAFRKRYPSHRLYWTAGLLWARSASDPASAEKRFRELAGKAPAGTRSECELEIAHLGLMQDRFEEAEAAYASWVKTYENDERRESALFWRGACLREMGKEKEARDVLAGLLRKGRQSMWRSLSALLLAAMEFESGDSSAARRSYLDLSNEGWAAEVRPQALLGAAKSSLALRRSGEGKKLLDEIIREFPDTYEAVEAKSLLEPSAVAAQKWGVQVGAFSQLANAEAVKRTCEARGFGVEIIDKLFGSLALKAVVVGPYENRERAESAARSFRGGGANCIVIAY